MSFFQRMMYGRYGSDQLGYFLFGLYFLVSLAASFTHNATLSMLASALMIYCIFRMFSRNITKRRSENLKFLTLAKPTIQWFKLRRTMAKDKSHRYFKCPSCAQQLRAPKGKGTLAINCRNCGNHFQIKT